VKIATIWVGKGRVKWADAGTTEYTRRLPHHLGFKEIQIKPVPFKGAIEDHRDAEASKILAQVKGGDRLVALDERGVDLDSHAFAKLIDEATKMGTQRLVFAIGGPYGLGAAVRTHAWKTVRLSHMVLNHSIARLVLGEQLYRASTLLWGGQYHH
jgi:23S rRNA (pseudouridine1915-N3)-methyltransferase